MTIVDELKKLIVARGGQTVGVHTIAEACKALSAIEEKIENVLKAFTVDATSIGGSEDLLGKVVGDLQSDIVTDATRGKITGTSKYVSGYTGFSGVTEEQEGNYVALHAYVPDVTGVTIKILKKDGTEQALDADGLLIRRLADNRPITFTAYKDGYTPVTQTYDVSGIVKQPKA